jgi:hypothetical protein
MVRNIAETYCKCEGALKKSHKNHEANEKENQNFFLSFYRKLSRGLNKDSKTLSNSIHTDKLLL